MYHEELKKNLSQHQFTWLITGVAGFIGSNLLESLLKLGQKVIGIDNFCSGYQRNIDEVLVDLPLQYKNNFKFFKGDICSLTDCRQIMMGVDYVLHHAAFVSVPGSLEKPLTAHASNDVGFVNMLCAAKDHGVKRFIYASSCAVYGDSPMLPKVETRAGNPLSLYAASKLTNELYARTFSLNYGIETIGLRYFNVFGARQNSSGAYAAVIPSWITAMLHNEPVFINGDGETTRDFCYIENVVQANLLAAVTTKPSAINNVYNIAMGEQTSLNQLAAMIASVISSKQKPKIHYRKFRLGDIRYSLADISEAKEKLGYEPTHKVYEGLQESIEWYIKFFERKINDI